MMDIFDAIRKRYSVRQYKDIPIEPELVDALNAELEAINKEASLHFQLILNEPRAFDSRLAHYGKFSGVSNYIALVGKKCDNLQEKVGYYGQRLVLKATQLGLHTCWVALTYKKIPNTFVINEGEKLTVVISIGHGRNRGLPRKSKAVEQVSNASDNTPEWFLRGVQLALRAPTAMNQQKFHLTYNDDGTVSARAGIGFYTKMDLGIVKYHFEIGAGKESFNWK